LILAELLREPGGRDEVGLPPAPKAKSMIGLRINSHCGLRRPDDRPPFHAKVRGSETAARRSPVPKRVKFKSSPTSTSSSALAQVPMPIYQNSDKVRIIPIQFRTPALTRAEDVAHVAGAGPVVCGRLSYA
jgi:hypothetical protein